MHGESGYPKNGPGEYLDPHNYPREEMAPHNYPREEMAPHNYPREEMAPHNYPREEMAPHNYPREESNPLRREIDSTEKIALPFYIVVDTSPSMSPIIPQVEETVTDLKIFFKQNRTLADIARVSIITFDHSARTLVPLGNLANVEEKISFEIGRSTNFVPALQLLRSVIPGDIDGLKSQGFGKVHRPSVFWISDGECFDDDQLEAEMQLLRDENVTKYEPNIFPFGFAAAVPRQLGAIANTQREADKKIWLAKNCSANEAMKSILNLIQHSLAVSSRSAAAKQPIVVGIDSEAVKQDPNISEHGVTGDFV